ncbi:MAG: cellulase family glycosylhydrolase [Polyangia bacterium]
MKGNLLAVLAAGFLFAACSTSGGNSAADGSAGTGGTAGTAGTGGSASPGTVATGGTITTTTALTGGATMAGSGGTTSTAGSGGTTSTAGRGGTTTASGGRSTATGGAATDAGVDVSPDVLHDGPGNAADARADVRADAAIDGSVDAGPPSDATPGGTMFVANGQIFDATGAVFLPWGVNKAHVDQENVGLELTGTNAVRANLYFRLPNATTTNLFDRFYAAYIVVIPGRWDATCIGDNTFAAALASEVDAWVAEAAAWKKYERASMINIANEAGPSNSTVWRDEYITAVGRMRAAGYGGLLMIDSGGCGQDVDDIVKYGAAVLAADPLQNIVFSLHVYGDTPDVTTLNTNLDRLKATGLSIVIGEFGPGRDIGPSPTNLAPADLMASALARGIGTLAWAADDNDLANSMADDNWFCMFYNLTKAYAGDAADLTIFGKVVVDDPTVGLLAVAKKASGF